MAAPRWTPPLHDPARELRAHLDVSGWRAAVEAVAARHGLPRTDLAPFPSGSDVVWGGAGFVVKLTAPRWRAELANEVRSLEHVAGRLSVHTPEVRAEGELEGWPYVVLERVEGVALEHVWPRLDRDERLRLAAELGALAAELHALPACPAEANELDETTDAAAGFRARGWDAFWSACRAEPGARHRRGDVPAALVDSIPGFLASVGPLDDRRRGFLHTELLGQHLLVDASRTRLAGLIDFADARHGAVEYDFPAPVEFVLRGEPGLFDALLAGYGERPGRRSPEQRLAWGLLHRFGSLERMLRAAPGPAPRTLEELAGRLYA